MRKFYDKAFETFAVAALDKNRTGESSKPHKETPSEIVAKAVARINARFDAEHGAMDGTGRSN